MYNENIPKKKSVKNNHLKKCINKFRTYKANEKVANCNLS